MPEVTPAIMMRRREIADPEAASPGQLAAPQARPSRALDLAAVVLADFLGMLPRRAAAGAGGVVGRAASLAGGSKNSRARRNLSCAGVRDTALACRRGWSRTGRTAFEMLWMLSHSPGEVLDAVTVHGLEDLKEAQRHGKGILLVSAHCGNWETVPIAVAREGIPVSVVARTLRAPSIERRLVAWRKAAGVNTLVRGVEGSSVAAYRALATGGALGCMMDRASTGRRVAVPFLGGWTNVPVGPLALAFRTGSATIAGVSRGGSAGRSEITFRRVPSPEPSNLPRVAADVMSAVEERLRDRPEEWFWIYRRQPTPQVRA